MAAASLFLILVLVSAVLLAATVFFFVATYFTRREKEEAAPDLEKGTLPLPLHPTKLDDADKEIAVAVKKCGWDEIERLTMGFTAPVIGHGGFSTVYLGRHSESDSDTDSGLVAVKVHRESERLHQAFKQELDALLRIRHHNIVRLLSYCDDKAEEGALVFECIPNGTLHEKLHGNGEFLTWCQRTAIAYDLANAINYLHSTHDLQIVHGDIKPSNILLDSDLRPKLCDFGSSKIGFSSTITTSAARPRRAMVGSPGYADPHYLRTGLTSKKSDVYSFGVVLLEMVTGKEGFCEKMGMMVVGEEIMVDGRIEGEVNREEMEVVVGLAKRCVGDQPSLRPGMGEILGVLGKKVKFAEGGAGASAGGGRTVTEDKSFMLCP